jgi:hypothetical protein
MAAEDELPESLRDLNEMLKTLNNTVETSAERQKKFYDRLQNNALALEKFAQQVRSGTKTVKEYEEKKAAYEIDAAKRARSLAQEQLAAEKETKTLAFQFMKAAGASIENQKALLVWGGRLKATGQTLSAIGGSMGSFAKGLAEGDTKFTSLNPLIDGVVGAMAKLAEAIPFVGGALSGAMKLAAEGAKFMNQQLQVATDTFQELSSVGALTTKGMSGVQEQFLRSGLPLESFRRQIMANSNALATFRGSVGSGADDFSKIVGAVVDGAGEELRRLGFSADAMGEATAGFVKMQSTLGLAQQKTNSQLARGAAEYAKELDTLAKLTGQQRKQIEEQQDAALSEGRFRAQYDEMVAQGQEKQAKALLDFQTQVNALSPQFAAGIRDMSTGLTNSQAAIKAFNTTGGAVQGIVERLKRGEIDQSQAMRELQAATKQQMGTTRTFAKAMGDGNDVFIDYAQTSKLVNAEQKDLAKVQADAVKQMTKGQDPLTDSAVGAQQGLEKMSREVNNLAFQILPNYASVLKSTTDVMYQGIRKLSGALGVPSPVGGGGAGGAGGGGAGAAPGGRGGRGGRGAGGGGAGGGAAGGTGALSDYLVFGGNTGSQANFDALDTDFKNRFIAMAQEYNQITGDKLRINSAYRSAEDQAALMARGGNGANPIAQPGMSLHQRGIAVDVNSEQRRTLQSMGLLGKYNMSGLPNDPPHIQSLAMGGVATGPKSGYAATLHGNEAVVPLPDGRTIPVEMPSLSNNIEQQVSMLGAQLATMQEMVRYMRDGNAISTKLLQAANN